MADAIRTFFGGRRSSRSRGSGSSGGSADSERTLSQPERTTSQPRRSVDSSQPRRTVDSSQPRRSVSSRHQTLLQAGRPSSSSRPPLGPDAPRSSRQLFQDQIAPDVHQVRMPEVHREPMASPAPSDADSTEGPTLPNQLFMPYNIPAIPEVDDRGVPIWPPRPQYVSAAEAYRYEPFETPALLMSARLKAKSTEASSSSGSSSRNTRGVICFETLRRSVETRGRIQINEPPNEDVKGKKRRDYAGCVGALIRDRVPMLWTRWADVPEEIKREVDNAASTYFEIADHKQDWAYAIQNSRFKEWKNELRTHFAEYDRLGRMGTPKELMFREYEWRWLKTVDFNNPIMQERSRQNSVNRRRNTTLHHGGSRPFSQYQEEALRDHPEANPYVETFKRVYPQTAEDLERVNLAEEDVYSAVVRETQPNISEEDLREALTQVDRSNVTTAARIFDAAFPNRSNDYYCRGLGNSGMGVLKTVKGAEKKGGGDTQKMREEMQRLAEENARLAALFETSQEQQRMEQQRIAQEQHRRAQEQQRRTQHYAMEMERWNAECERIRRQNYAGQQNWWYAMFAAQQKGHEPPPPFEPLDEPRMPRVPEFLQQDDEDGGQEDAGHSGDDLIDFSALGDD